MASLVKSVMLKIVADDGDSEAKLDKITAKAEELGRLHPDLTPKIDTAAASAKLAVLRTELKDTANAADGDSASLKSRLMGLTGAVASITGVGDAMTLASGDASMFQKVMAGASLATGLLEPLAAGAIVGVMGLGSGIAAAGVGAGIFGLVAKQAFSTVSTNITSATKAYEQLSTAQTKAQKTAGLEAWKKSLTGLNEGQRTLVIDTAKAEVTWDNFVKNSTAGIAQTLAPALALLPKALGFASQFLGPVEAALQDIFIDVKQAMGSPFWTSTISEWAATSGPMIEDIAVAIGHVIHGIAGILTTFMPMSTSLGAGLDSITEKFAKWGETLGSHSGFQSLMSMAKTEAPMAMTVLKNLATVLLNVGKAMTGMDGVGNSKTLLQVLQPLSGVLASLSKNQDLDRIALYLLAGADAGKKLSSTVSGISNGLKLATGGASGISNLVKGMRDADVAAADTSGKMGTLGGAVKTAFSSIGTGAAAAGTAVVGVGSKIKSAATAAIEFGSNIATSGAKAVLAGAQWAASAAKMLVLKTAQLAVAAATKIWTGVQAALDVVMDANPIVLIIAAIALLAIGITLLVVKCKPFREFWISMWGDVEKAALSAWNFLDKDVFQPIVKGVGDLVNFVKAHWQLLATILATILLGPLAGLVVYVATHFKQIESAASSLVSNVTSFFRSLPGKIVGALGNLGSLLFNAGKNIIQGLINGIKSMVGDVSGAVSNIVSDIRNFLPFSPAKKGPLSGSGNPQLAGAKIGQMLAAGLESSTGAVAASAHKVAGAATITGGAASAASMASSVNGMSLSVQGGGGSQFNQFMATWIKNYVRVNFGGNVQKAFGH